MSIKQYCARAESAFLLPSATLQTPQLVPLPASGHVPYAMGSSHAEADRNSSTMMTGWDMLLTTLCKGSISACLSSGTRDFSFSLYPDTDFLLKLTGPSIS